MRVGRFVKINIHPQSYTTIRVRAAGSCADTALGLHQYRHRSLNISDFFSEQTLHTYTFHEWLCDTFSSFNKFLIENCIFVRHHIY